MKRPFVALAAAVLIGVMAAADHLLTELVGRHTTWPPEYVPEWMSRG